MKNKLILISSGVIVACAFFAGMAAIVESATTTVTVNASVATSITCNTSTTTIALGVLTSNAIASSSKLASASSSFSCNTGLGCTLQVSDAGNASNGGLATGTPAYLIPSPNASFTPSTTLVAGTEGYGIQASTTSEGSGGSITLDARYASTTYASVGGLRITAVTLASSTAQISNRSLLVSHWAAISGTTQAGQYVDTITYSCISN